MSAFRSVGARLSLALLGVVAIALTLVYLVVIPSLKSRLVDSKLRQLERSAPRLAAKYPTYRVAQDFVDDAAFRTNARVVAANLVSSEPPLLQVVWDSRQGAPPADSNAIEADSVAIRAALTRSAQHGVVHRRGEEYAEVAVPAAGSNFTLLFSSPLHDAFETVDFVERRLVVAGLLALLVALAIGGTGVRAPHPATRAVRGPHRVRPIRRARGRAELRRARRALTGVRPDAGTPRGARARAP
jgi:hypothetical protein